MSRLLALAALFAAPVTAFAQSAPLSALPVQVATADSRADAAAAALPDAPSTTLAAHAAMLSSSDNSTAIGQAAGINAGSANSNIAPKYARIILPGQSSIPLTAENKVIYGFAIAFSPYALVSSTIAAGYSHLANTGPHYGVNSEAFGKREGVAALRGTVQTLATDALFDPVFHDDPRYYALGRGHKLLDRVVYAGTRVVVARSDSGQHRVNAPLLLGYGSAAALNNLYYPDRDTGAKATLTSYATSLGGAALGMEVSEFLDDALRIVHLRKN